jgi:hypothetical protein
MQTNYFAKPISLDEALRPNAKRVVLVCAAHVVIACEASDVLQAELSHG